MEQHSQLQLTMMKSLKEMKELGEFCDLVFELGHAKFVIHRLLLAAWSPKMRQLLGFHSALPQCIQVIYDQPEAFEQFVSFLYTGVAEQFKHIHDMLLLASTFQVDALKDQCEEHLKASLTVDNVICYHRLAVKFQLLQLESLSVQFLQQQLADVVQKKGFRELSPLEINLFLGSEHVSQLRPEIILFLIISWITEDVLERQHFLVLLLKHINWSLVAQDFLEEISQTENFFTSNPSSLYLLLQTLQSSSISLGPYETQFDTLKEEYGYLLGRVVGCSVALGTRNIERFEPIHFTFSSSDYFKNATEIRTEACHDEEIDEVENNDLQNELDSNDGCLQSQHLLIQRENDVNVNSLSSKNNSIMNEINSPNKICLRPRKLLSKKESNFIKRKPVRRKRKDHPDTLTKKSTHGIIQIEQDCLQDDFGENSKQDSCALNERKLKSEMKDADTKTPKRTTKKNFFNGNEIVNKKNKKIENKESQLSSRISEDLRISGGNKPKTKIRSQNFSSSDCDFKTNVGKKLDKKQVHKGNCLFCCNLCTYKSKWNKEYQNHLKQVHFSGPPFQCDNPNCSYTSDKFSGILSHRKQHSDVRPYVCDICLAAFRSRNNLHAHFKTHSDEKKFQCPECKTSFKLKITLEQHMVTHSDHRPYLCDLCGFATKFQSHLIAHKRIHTGEVYRCNFPSCTYSTPKGSLLKSHMRTHLGIRSHVCSICGRAFVEKSHLVRHERIHSSERSHTCSDCNYSSNRADKLREHRQRHHSVDSVSTHKKSTKGRSKPSEAQQGKLPELDNPAVVCQQKPKAEDNHNFTLLAVTGSQNVSSRLDGDTLQCSVDLTEARYVESTMNSQGDNPENNFFSIKARGFREINMEEIQSRLSISVDGLPMGPAVDMSVSVPAIKVGATSICTHPQNPDASAPTKSAFYNQNGVNHMDAICHKTLDCIPSLHFDSSLSHVPNNNVFDSSTHVLESRPLNSDRNLQSNNTTCNIERNLQYDFSAANSNHNSQLLNRNDFLNSSKLHNNSDVLSMNRLGSPENLYTKCSTSNQGMKPVLRNSSQSSSCTVLLQQEQNESQLTDVHKNYHFQLAQVRNTDCYHF